MNDTPERVDHAEAIRQYAQRVRSLADAITERAEPMTMRAFGDIEDDTTAIEQHADGLAADGLAADLARVVAYARDLEAKYIEALDNVTPHRRQEYPKVGPFRAEHGVADLMRDTNKEAR